MKLEELFPYPFRRFQRELVESVYSALSRGEHLILNSPTGTGKTVSVLTPALLYALERGKRILYLTRTNSQQRQVILEMRRIVRRINELSGGEGGEVFPDISPGPAGLDERTIKEVIEEAGGLPMPPGGDGMEREGAGSGEGDAPGGGGWEGPQPPGAYPPQETWIYAVPLQGRSNLCPMIEDDPEALTGTPEELSKLCSHLKKNALRISESGGGSAGKHLFCPYFLKLLSFKRRDVQEYFILNHPTAEEFSGHMRGEGICPYEALKMIIPEATVVVAPYIFFFAPYIRKRLLDWMGAAEDEIIVLVDEAHNLEDFARDVASISITTGTLRLALKEMEREGDMLIGEGLTISTLLTALRDAILGLAEEYLEEEDGAIPPHALIEMLMEQLRVATPELYRAIAELERIGEAIEEKRKKKGKLPRSYLGAIARFLMLWGEIDFSTYVPVVERRGSSVAIVAACLDPSVTTAALNRYHSTVHFSGTLRPLRQYADAIGLEGEVVLEDFPSPFPQENLFICYEKGVSTRYELIRKDPEMLIAMARRLRAHLETFSGVNKIVFFPSFNIMNEILERLRNAAGYGGEIIREERGMTQRELMEAVETFREGGGKTLFSVMGGRVSEGMDFPARDLELVIICGIPYPKPTARNKAQISYYERRFGRGWDYAVHTPAARKILQAIGRLIRSEHDRGAAVILDERASAFREEIPSLTLCEDSVEAAKTFLSGKNVTPSEGGGTGSIISQRD